MPEDIKGTAQRARSELLSYSDLLARKQGIPGSSWGLFGAADQVGTISLLDAESVRNAAALVRRGVTFNLDYELNAFAPPVSPYRKRLQHFALCRHDGQVHDDYVSDFFPQASSHIDGLRHHRHKTYGFYNSVSDGEVSADSRALGIQHVAARGIVGRGVLVDIERYLQSQGRGLDHRGGQAIAVADLDAAVRAQGVKLQRGDVLLLHTGWARHFLNDLNDDERLKQIKDRTFTGLAQSRDALAWIWDNHVAVMASDTVAVEVMPTVTDSPFADSVAGMMHPHLIAMLGVCLGELWNLDELARDCAGDRVYEFMVTSKPLNLVGGVGSPANALALK